MQIFDGHWIYRCLSMHRGAPFMNWNLKNFIKYKVMSISKLYNEVRFYVIKGLKLFCKKRKRY